MSTTRTTEPGGGTTGTGLALLGGFRLVRDRHELQVPPVARRLVAFLGIHDRPLPRNIVAAALWTEADETQANARLRTTLYRMRRASGLVDDATNGGLQLAPEVDVDVRRVRQLAQCIVAREHGDGRLPTIDDGGLAVMSRELLPDWDELWVVNERERMRQLCLHALEARARRLTDQGRFAEAIETAQQAVQMEDLRESAHRELIRAHVEEGNYALALEQYQGFRRRLHNELGIEPSPMLAALMSSITRV